MAHHVTAIFIIVSILLMLPIQGQTVESGETDQNFTSLTSLSDRILQYTDTKRLEAAESLLSALEKEWAKQRSKFSEADGKVIDTSVTELKLLMQSGVDNTDEIRHSAASLRLSVDALTTINRPLWIGLRQQVLEPFNDMKKALETKNYTGYQEKMNQFLKSYTLIYPAMVIDISPEILRGLNEQVNALSVSRSAAGQERKRIMQVDRLQKELTAVFDQTSLTREDRLMTLLSIIGGFLLVILSFVSWRKYVHERRRRRNEVTE